MKLKPLFCLLILLQLVSCDRRYACLKKIRVPRENKKEAFLAQQKKKTADTIVLEKSPVVLNLDELFSRNHHTTSKLSTHPKQKETEILSRRTFSLPKIITKPSPPKPAPLGPKQEPNKQALSAFVFSLLAIVCALFLVEAAIMLLLAIVFSSLAFLYGVKARRSIGNKRDKRKWMAITGIIIGAIILSGVIALSIVYLVTTDQFTYSASIRNAFIILSSIFFTLMMIISFKQKKGKAQESTKRKHSHPESWNRAAIYAFLSIIMATITIIILGSVTTLSVPALLAIFALLFIVAGIFLGIYALLEIKSTHQKGKFFAWLGILFVPMVLMPLFGLIVLFTFFILWIVKKSKRKKKKEVSLA